MSRIYAVDWGLIPNIAIDLIMPPMLQVMPLFTAGKVMLAVTVLLPVLGAVLYSRALFGRWSFWSLGCGLVAYNGITLLGFMNFQIGLGLALVVAAGWIEFRDRAPVLTVLGCALGAVVLFFLHVFSVLFLAVLLGSHEVTRLYDRWRAGQPIGPALVQSAIMLACVFALPIVFYGLSALSGNAPEAKWRSLARKSYGLFLPFLNYRVNLDLGTGIVIGAGVLFAWWRGWMRVPLGTVVAMVVLAIGYAVSPFSLKGASFVDLRMPAMMGFLLFAGMAPVAAPRRVAAVAGAGIAGLFAVRMAVLVTVWIGSQADVARVREAIAPVQPGSKVLLTISDWEDNPAYWRKGMERSRRVTKLASTFIHLAALLTIERNAFWPLLFAEPAKQPIHALPPYRHLSIPEGWPPSYELLDKERPDEVMDSEDLEEAPYLRGWERHYDYVLILNAGGVPDLRRVAPGKLDLIEANDMAALFRVRRPLATLPGDRVMRPRS
jgi:hypothetical protein